MEHEHQVLDVPAPEIVVDDGDSNSTTNASGVPPAGNGAGVDHVVDADDLKNMRLSIGTLDRTIVEISLGDNNLTAGGSRHIDIRLRDNKNLPRASSGGVGSGNNQAAPAGRGDDAPSSSRLKITVAADDPQPDADWEYLVQMRGWLMTVATLFVGISFQAVIQPPDWVRRRLERDQQYQRTPSPRLSDQEGTWEWDERVGLALYMVTNLMTFGSALGVVLVLLHARMKTSSAKRTMGLVTRTVSFSIGTALTFAMAAMSVSWFCVVTMWVAIASLTSLVILWLAA